MASSDIHTAAEHSTGSAGSLVPVTDFHATNPSQRVYTSATFSSPLQTSLTLHTINSDICQTGNLNFPPVYKKEYGAFCRKVLANLNIY